MTFTKPVKLLLGALTIWPLVYMFLFMDFIATTMFWMGGPGAQPSEDSTGIPTVFLLVFAAHAATILLMFGLVTFYIVYLFKSNRVPPDKKALWAAVLFLGNMLAMPIFLYLYI
jgi:hypothetical protein